ncbi:TPA: hypothetical protein REW47_000792 [Staphylococcus pseudintermedius]|uniref:hypothetical protein n=1 Tax=Staphylococcus pseudintermedius TaxID=283734 RepID=UPI001933C31A|nr:hypothetical protein [Staphylococcus pseudintermedius]EKI4463807.1 hypothetical protein [Staphylococcus pseudintermedius]ELH8582594.1 hypothetical protein [Staphylococcus pseudintermedius]MBM0288601.1 hypothetical protein [Staphylococcus pseudintermedius]HAR6508659.1 hypothetical protein [Staphylococcus pseudintermedius]HDU1314428.1 hypothetical protein [Staphylococcus pseudintermedius]
MKRILAIFSTVAVAIVLTTVLAFSGVYLTTLLFVVIIAEAVTYNLTKYVYDALKKTDSNGNC